METCTEHTSKLSVLVVDDELEVAKAFSRGLAHAGYEVCTAHSADEALDLLATRRFEVLLTDIHMPGMHGDELQSRARRNDRDLAVLMITAAQDITTAVECLKDGAFDYMVKPVPLAEIVVRVGKALERRRLVIENRDYQANLETRVNEQAERIRTIFQQSLQSLIQALEAKDENTRNHSSRVSDLASALAARLRADDPAFTLQVKVAALFHDIGKIGVPEAILHKPGRLTPEEMAVICKHPEIGEQIMKPLFSDADLLAIVRSHHEQHNGCGYPDRLSGAAIPFGARIVAVSDSYDAMTSIRPYRPAMPRSQALQILSEGAGKQWDSSVVAMLLTLADEGRLDEVIERDKLRPVEILEAAISAVAAHVNGDRPLAAKRPARPVVAVPVELENGVIDGIMSEVGLLVDAGNCDFVLDFGEVGGLCPEAIETFAILHRQTQNSGGHMAVRNPHGQVLEDIRKAGLLNTFFFEWAPIGRSARN